jgi:hypothetical protein
MENQKPQETAIQSSSSQSSVSTTNFILRQRPAGSSEKFGEIWRLEVDRSREDGRVIETRETFTDNEATRLFRKNTGLDRNQTNRKNVQPTITFGLTDNNSIEYEEGGSASIGEIEEENLETTEPTETLLGEENSQPQPASKANRPSLFKIGLSLLILGIFGLALLCFANWTNKNQVYKFQRKIHQNHYSKTATK